MIEDLLKSSIINLKSPTPVVILLLRFDGDLLRFDGFALGQMDRQHAMLQLRSDLVGIDGLVDGESAIEVANAVFIRQVVYVLMARRAFGVNRQLAILEAYIDISRLNTRQVRVDSQLIGGFQDVTPGSIRNGAAARLLRQGHIRPLLFSFAQSILGHSEPPFFLNRVEELVPRPCPAAPVTPGPVPSVTLIRS